MTAAKSLESTAASLVLGVMPGDNLPDIAACALEAGRDSRSLRQLAGLSLVRADEGLTLFRLVATELGLSWPTPRQALLLLARELADAVLRRNISAYAGAKQIWDLTLTARESTPDLDPFVYAASEWEERPEERAFFEEEIRKAAEELFAAQV